MKLGQLGIWANLDNGVSGLAGAPGSAAQHASAKDNALLARRIEALGYSALWMPEGLGRNPLVHAAWLLANTDTLIVATGIANIYARDPISMRGAQAALNEQSGGRFLLGLGVSHAKFVDMRGHDYGKPVATMRTYLEAMAATPYTAAEPTERPLTVLAALRDKMLALSGERADGAHPLNVTPDHTAHARAILGPDKLLCVEQKLVLETDPAKARAIGRAALHGYLQMENYCNLWKSLGFSDEDMSSGGSDRLIDSLIGWGDETALRKRIQDHLDAGADHVCINPLAPDGSSLDMGVIAALAPARPVALAD
jgi:probable F420-dependent oxidoreductase